MRWWSCSNNSEDVRFLVMTVNDTYALIWLTEHITNQCIPLWKVNFWFDKFCFCLCYNCQLKLRLMWFFYILCDSIRQLTTNSMVCCIFHIIKNWQQKKRNISMHLMCFAFWIKLPLNSIIVIMVGGNGDDSDVCHFIIIK